MKQFLKTAIKKNLHNFPWLSDKIYLRAFDKYDIMNSDIYEGRTFSNWLEESIRLYAKEKPNIEDIKLSFMYYHIKPNEYYLFDFPHKSRRERNTYLSDIDKDNALIKISGLEKYNELKDKFTLYKRLKKYYGRDACLVKSKNDEENFLTFISHHPSVFFKPNQGSYGNGCSKKFINNKVEAKKIFETLLKTNSEWIIEEVITQAKEMADWNESSVNTIRIPAFLRNNKFSILTPQMKTGRKGAIVDNGGNGGIISVINEKSGCIYTDGFDEIGNRYDVHPDSKIRFKGFKVPKWKQLLSLVEEAQREMPEHIYIAWDAAYTKNGWIIVEGNWGQFIGQQMCGSGGVKYAFYKNLGLK